MGRRSSVWSRALVPLSPVLICVLVGCGGSAQGGVEATQQAATALAVFETATSEESIRATRAARPTPTPQGLIASGWEGVTVGTLCLEVEQSFPGVEEELSLPLLETVQHVLRGLGLEVVAAGESCDAALTLTLAGQAMGADYDRFGYCYTGVKVEVDATLSSNEREHLTFETFGQESPPLITAECPLTPDEAPYAEVWSAPLLDCVGHLWGRPTVLVQALGVVDVPEIRAEAREQLPGVGAEAVPLLVEALADEDWWMRSQSAEVLGEIGPQRRRQSPRSYSRFRMSTLRCAVPPPVRWARSVVQRQGRLSQSCWECWRTRARWWERRPEKRCVA
jgi:hypothetical protein